MINPQSETIEQQKLVQYLRVKKILHYAIPNENQSSFTNRAVAVRVEAKAKSMGKSKGVPDICIPIPNKYYHGLYIELKRARKRLKNGKTTVSHTKVSQEQEKWIQKLKEQGYYALVCYGAEEAIEVIEKYMENRK